MEDGHNMTYPIEMTKNGAVVMANTVNYNPSDFASLSLSLYATV
jgi:hypothetical protein